MSVTAMKEFIDFTVELVLNLLMKKKPQEKASIAIEGVACTRRGDFAELRGRHAFSPKFFIEGVKVKDQAEGERLYLTWRELASEKFFEDVEKMFEMIQKRK